MSKTTDIVKCASCGADMAYDPKTGTLKCSYCGSGKTVERAASFDRDYYKYVDEGKVREGGFIYQCPNCHAETTVEDFSTAVSCPFCGATNIVKTNELSGLKPDSILPFTKEKTDASESARKYIKNRLFAPRKLKKTFVPDGFKGLYFPSFNFNVKTKSTYHGTLGKYYTVTVGTGNNKRTETRIRYFNVSGSYEELFNNLLIEASSHLTQKDLNKLSPFDTNESVSYKPEFLAGYSAERYSTSLKESFNLAKGKIDAQIRQNILKRYDADVVQSLTVETLYNPVTFKYILLPLWICAYNYKNKLYNLFVNGRNGKATGKVPVSPLKVLFTVLVALGIAAVLVILALKGYL
ncbi:MAG: TFIIB-type zinc ribbon-containing protein [Clostridiales bacterium]|nr:TFIIB-type zinc ribbon-containing protein [Clostridiales bacterium]